MTGTADIVIIGGGIQGCSAALHLAQRGFRPLVIEKDYVGRHASGVNAGGVRTLGRDEAEIPLALAARAMWGRIAELVDDGCGFRVSGQLRVATTPEALRKLTDRRDRLFALGYRHENLIGTNELAALAPALAREALGALYVESDGYAEPYRTTIAFARRARAQGATILEGRCVEKIARQGTGWVLTLAGGETIAAGSVINCAGAWAAKIGQKMGDPLAITANGSMQMVTSRLPPLLEPVVGVEGRAVSIKQFPNGTIIIGGGRRSPIDLATNVSTIEIRGLAAAAADARAILPPLADARIVRFWSGIEGFTPDRLPILDAATQGPGFHAAGFSAHGFQLGPLIGKIIADMVIDGKTDLPIAPFRMR